MRKSVIFFSLLILLFSESNFFADGRVRVIPYKISPEMWYGPKGGMIPTPQPAIEKVKKVFELWGSVEESNVTFRFAGLDLKTYSQPEQIPKDGTIHIVLKSMETTERSYSALEAAFGGYNGKIPYSYIKGYVFMELEKGSYVFSFKTLTHEIGHALGLNHAASIASVMTCGTPAWGDHEFLYLSEQNRSDLARLWNPAFRVYSLSGKVETSREQKHSYVFAVDAKNGRTYSQLTKADGVFNVAVPHPGSYRLFAKSDEAPMFNDPSGESPSWYVANGKSTLEPYQGKIFELNDNALRMANLKLKIIEEKVSFNLSWAHTENSFKFNQAFLKPGSEGVMQLMFSISNEDPLESLAAYGAQPDYRIELLDPIQGIPQAKVSAMESALQGERLVIARSKSGKIQAGLIGIQVLNNLPDGIDHDLSNESGEIEKQIDGNYDFSRLRAAYWKI